MRVLPTADLAQLIGPAPFDIEPHAPAFADFTPAPSAPVRIFLDGDAPAIAPAAPTASTDGAAILGCILGCFALLAFAALIFASLASVGPATLNHAPAKHIERMPQHMPMAYVEAKK